MRLVILALAMLSPHAVAHDVWVVDHAGLGDFLTVQEAVDAAASGDSVLIKAGYYSWASTDKALNFVGDPGASVGVSTLSIYGPPADSDAFISGIDTRITLSGAAASHDLRLLIEGLQSPNIYAERSVRLSAGIASLTIVDSHMRGDDGSNGDGEEGDDALERLIHSTCDVYTYRSTFHGGNGGDGYGWTCSAGGPGGHGISMDGGRLFSRELDAAGGMAGDGCGGSNPGVPVVLWHGAEHHPLLSPHSSLEVPNVVREGDLIQVVIEAAPGTIVDLLSSSAQADRLISLRAGVLHLRVPLRSAPVGTIPASGQLSVSMVVPDLAPGEEGEVTYFQAILMDSLGNSFFSNPSGMLVLDASL